MRDRRLLALAALAFCVPLVAELGPRDANAFRFAVADPGRWVRIQPGERLCQRGIDVPVAFASVVVPDTAGRVESEVRGARSAGGRIDVCLTTPDAAPAWVGAARGFAVPRSEADLDGRPVPADVHLDFVRAEPASFAARLGEIVPRLALYKPAWLGEGLIVALGLAVVLGVPLLLLAAVRSVRDG